MTTHGFDGDADCDGDDDGICEHVCDDACEHTAGHDAGHDSPAIVGRIGTPSGEQTAGELVEMMLRLGQRLRGHLDNRFGAFGLSDARFAALQVIREAAPAGCTQAHLAARLGQCESSISTLVERMRASRLLYRLRAKADRRKRVLMLTDDGRALFDQGLAARDREAEALFSRMTREEQQSLAANLGRLFATLDKLGAADRVAERPAA
jgi:MarR family transcriptional regulator for hemolysin